MRLPVSHLQGMSRLRPLRQARRLGSLAACGRFGEALEPLAPHHHPPPPAAFPACPMTGPILTSNPCRSHPANPSRGSEKIAIPRRLDPSHRNPFSEKSFPRADARPATYLRSFLRDDPRNSGAVHDHSNLTLWRPERSRPCQCIPPVLCGLARPTSPATAPANNFPLQPAAEFLAQQNCRLPPSSAALRPTLPPKSGSRGCKPGS